MKIDWRGRWREVFSVDLRSLALFRFTLGSVVAVDMLNRLVDVRTFYTDWGLMPRDWAVAANGPLRLSLHLISGDTWFAVLLLLAEAAAGLALAFGYRTRLATFIAFVLEGSLLNRNPFVLLGGDTLLVCLLFWGLFLPLNARWSVDAALSPRPPPEDNRHFSAAGAGLIIQVLSVWFFSSILKSGSDWWPDGTAVYYTMSLERYSTGLGRELLKFPLLMQGLSYFVYFLEMFGPVLALSPVLQRPLRFAVLLCLAAMHTGFIVFMEIGMFPFASLCSLTVLVGGWWWDRAGRGLDRGHSIRIYYDKDCRFCLKSVHLLRMFLVLRRCDIQPAQDSVRANALLQAQYSWVVIDAYDVAHTKWNAFVALLRHSLTFRWLTPLAGLGVWEKPGNWVYDWVGRHRGAFGKVTAALLPERDIRYDVPRPARIFAGVSLVCVIAWNAVTIQVLPVSAAALMQPLMMPLRIDQGWPMFAPVPWRDDGWYVIPGQFEDGSEVDLRTNKGIDWRKPENVNDTEPNVRWRTYHTMIWNHLLAGNRAYYGRWLCRDWNAHAEAGHHLLSLKIIFMLERTPPPGHPATVEQRVLWRHSCVDREAEQLEPTETPKPAPGQEEKKRPV